MAHRDLSHYLNMSNAEGNEEHKEADVTVVESETPKDDFNNTVDSENSTVTEKPDVAEIPAASEGNDKADKVEVHDHVKVEVPSTEEMPNTDEGNGVDLDKGEESEAEIETDTSKVGGDDDDLGEHDKMGATSTQTPAVSNEQRAYEAVKHLTKMRGSLESYRDLLEPTLETGGIDNLTVEAIRIGMESLDEEFAGDAVVPGLEDFAAADADRSRLTVKTLHRINQSIKSVNTAIGNAEDVLNKL